MAFRKSSYSAAGGAPHCVEVDADHGGMVRVRDSKNPDGPMLPFTPNEWKDRP